MPHGGAAPIGAHHNELLGYDEETLNELPFEIRQELLAEQNHIFRTSPRRDAVGVPPTNTATAETGSNGLIAANSNAVVVKEVPMKVYANMATLRKLEIPKEHPLTDSLSLLNENHIPTLLKLLYVPKGFSPTDWAVSNLLRIFNNMSMIKKNRETLISLLLSLTNQEVEIVNGFPPQQLFGIRKVHL